MERKQWKRVEMERKFEHLNTEQVKEVLDKWEHYQTKKATYAYIDRIQPEFDDDIPGYPTGLYTVIFKMDCSGGEKTTYYDLFRSCGDEILLVEDRFTED